MTQDGYRLRKRLAGLQRRARAGKPVDRGLREMAEAIRHSRDRRARREAQKPPIKYPEQLPVSARRAEIAEAIARHQVVVIAGETGSGKTTQLPKVCLELGRGAAGLIGHTQPRRIAARSVATRIAEELKTEPGGLVGYKVRFTDHTGPDSRIKLMTDGILLAEVQSDHLLTQYDTLIIDEAHERSLNIDFLLGYLKQLLPKRPDLKLIITSATINTESFSRFFDDAPVLEVSGRTYPVEVRYRPLLEEDEEGRDRDLPEAIIDAVDELTREDPLGDILIFLPGERQIRETAEVLRKHKMRETEVLPLYSRLSVAEQDRIFRGHRGRRIVLATNVAETSLTVPGIRFVIDPGQARISRYSHRTKVQRLPIEAISQASANQRSGRCGRVSAGVCIRLYAEQDYAARPRFTDPELLRTNLASVILQMAALGLGEVEAFPFLDAPDRRYVTDGYRLLHELGAVDKRNRLTEIGRKLARLPVDPRIGRMLLAADREGSLNEVLTIASALAVQDPRERPLDAQQAADTAHARFHDERSDFLSLLKLWDYYHEQSRHLSRSKLRKQCRKEFLSYLRLREWHDIHGQLLAQVKELGLRVSDEEADYGAIHRALLTGLLGNIAVKTEKHDYLGARNIKLAVFPGSGLFKKPPKWLVAAELVETSRLYARTVAKIDAAWIEPLARHLVKRHYSEPHWAKRPAQVSAYERVTLYGLPVVMKRPVNYGPIDPVLSRELFIRHALVEGEYRSQAPFFAHNRALIAEVEALEARSRRRDILVDEQVLYEFFDKRLPEGIYSGKHFESWRKKAERGEPRLLYLSREVLMQHEAASVKSESFPESIRWQGMELPLSYHFEPGEADDGVTLRVPLGALPALQAARFEWLVPGLLEEKLIALIKSLPKSLRRNFVPAVNFAEAALRVLSACDQPLTGELGRQLHRMTGVEVPAEAWNIAALPPHLLMNFRVVDEQGKTVAQGRELEVLQAKLARRVRASLSEAPVTSLERDTLKIWDFGELPEHVELQQQGVTLRAWPALTVEKAAVALRIFDSRERADWHMQRGLRKLLLLQLTDKVKYLRKNIPSLQQMCLYYAGLGSCEQLREDIIEAAVARVLAENNMEQARDPGAFDRLLEQLRDELVTAANELAATVADVLQRYHAIDRALKGKLAPDMLYSAADIREQLERLVHEGFVTDTPTAWMPHLPRYLQGIEKRLEKLAQSPERDVRLMRTMRHLWDAYFDWRQAAEPWQGDEPNALRFRWLLEELRVSLFAQELKTIESVSVKRLERLWKSIS